MNVLFVTNTLHRGGAEVHLLQLARGLRARGGRCAVAFLRSHVSGGSVDLRAAFEHEGIPTHYLGCERSCDPRAGFRLGRVLEGGRWDVLHSHLPRADGAAAVCMLLHPTPAWVSTLHHPYDNAYSAARLVPLMAPMWRRADRVIAVSDHVRTWGIERLGLAPERVETIVHGIDLPARRTGQGRADAGPGHRIGAIGRYEPRKGHEVLIRAMVRVLEAFPDAELRIGGHDPWGHGDALKRLVASLRLEGHVHLEGFIDDMDAFFAGIDVFAFASHSEGFGIVLLEAMAACKPAVVSDIAPLNQIVRPGESGLIAAPDDSDAFASAIVSMFRDPETMRRMALAAAERARSEFSTERMVDRTIACYRRVLSRSNAAASGSAT